ncbi:hypothetical protein BH10ACT7_BH10ACT7_09760 [soil metagenome]
MSPTSTDRRFGRALAGTIAVLFVLCGVFLALGYLQGPKLADASVDTAGVIDQPAQQLRLFANQALTEVAAEQVTITPAAHFTVSTSGDIISVQFTDRLLYDTKYTVRIERVTSVFAPQESTISYEFTTDSPELYYLDRGEPTDDIIRTTTAGTARESVYQAVGIQDFVALGKTIVVSILDGTDSRLVLASLTDVGEQDLRLPASGTIGQLQGASSGTIVGFTMTDDERQAGVPLYTIDLERTGGAQVVEGIDGEPLRVVDWRFLPGSTGIVAMNGVGDLLYVDPAKATVVPLGQFQSLVGVGADGDSVVVTDLFGAVILSVTDGSQERIEIADSEEGRAYLGPLVPLPDRSIIAKAVLGSTFSPVVLHADGDSTVVLYRTPGDAGSIQDISVSPNGQYVAVETVPDVAVSSPDGYAADGRDTNTTTVIVDVASGAIVSSFTGFALAW